MDNTALSLLGLEDELRQDADGRVKRRWLDDFEQLSFESKRALDKGVAPAESERLRQLRAAADASAEVVDRVWRRFNPQQTHSSPFLNP